MRINYDGSVDIATGMSVNSKIWKNKKALWSKLVTKLTTENKTNETLKEFNLATKSERSKIKDVGGYVGGYLRAGRRSPSNVVHRQLITLDVDYADLNFWDDFKLIYDSAAVIHATHSYTEQAPRYRLIMPINREVTPDEYSAISRSIAGSLNIERFDNSTFEVNRLMFWPSNPKDVEYYAEFQDGPWIDADAILSQWADWKDSSLWPTSAKNLQEVRDLSKKQQDPENKAGIVGSFCRTYSITQAIAELLADVYEPSVLEGRYTYTAGSTAAGLLIYDDKFAYSHHGTDPCGGKLCNSFDLVRIHKFGHLDDREDEDASRQQSYRAMEDFAKSDPKVKHTIARETLTEARYEFATPEEELPPLPEDALEWAEQLEVDGRGRYLSSAVNLNIIFSNDIRLTGAFKYNQFDYKMYVFKSLPWRTIYEPEPVKSVDHSGVRNYLEAVYGITGVQKIKDVLLLEFEREAFHPVQEYLSSLTWDGTPRIDTMLIDYFGADDNIYSREVARIVMAGAVARITQPGIKFDLVLTLVGEQGTGKSTFINRLGRGWSSDTFLTVHGKEAFEQLQGAWLIEMAELSGLRKAEVETIKHFISKQEDTYRRAYGEVIETFPRQCIFIGTTNNVGFLRDPTGNRRFLPIDVKPDQVRLSVFKLEDDTVNQLWAEAVQLFNNGQQLYLTGEAASIAQLEQDSHQITDDRAGIIEDYLNTPLPEAWESMDNFARSEYLSDPTGDVPRVYVCVAEIWVECFGRDKKDMDRYKTREINEILRGFREWEFVNSTREFKLYGKQKYYARKIRIPN